MAGSVNKVILIGNLGADPEVRRLNSGDQVVNFRLATTDSWRDKTTGERKERTEWHNVVIFNENLGKIAEQYCKKGTKVYVEGPPDAQVAGPERSGSLHDRGRAAAFPRRVDAPRLARRRRRPRQLPRRGRFARRLARARRRRSAADYLQRRRTDRRRHSVLR